MPIYALIIPVKPVPPHLTVGLELLLWGGTGQVLHSRCDAETFRAPEPV